MGTRKLVTILAAAVMFAVAGCATDNAVEKDAKNAAPQVKKGTEDAKNAASDAADAIDDNDSK